METTSESVDRANASLTAGNIVSDAVQLTRHLFCPFCGHCFLYEFMLKDHLKHNHPVQLKEYATQTDLVTGEIDSDTGFIQVRDNLENTCKFCGTVFYADGLLPKHIADFHGQMCFNIWRNQQNAEMKNDGMSSAVNTPSKSEGTTFVYAQCSPGLSEIFNKITTCDSDDLLAVTPPTTPLKSILKKSASKSAASRIICSPSAAGIRRVKNTTLVRRSSSVRRELRFDFSDENNLKIDSGQRKGIAYSVKRTRTMNWFLFGCVTREKKSPKRLVTSTPVNAIDESDCVYLMKRTQTVNEARSTRTKPLFTLTERYQCAHCDRAWESNADLLTHLTEKHKHVRRWFQADYRCAMCAAKFYSNRFLVRHCHNHHTPVKRLR